MMLLFPVSALWNVNRNNLRYSAIVVAPCNGRWHTPFTAFMVFTYYCCVPNLPHNPAEFLNAIRESWLAQNQAIHEETRRYDAFGLGYTLLCDLKHHFYISTEDLMSSPLSRWFMVLTQVCRSVMHDGCENISVVSNLSLLGTNRFQGLQWTDMRLWAKTEKLEEFFPKSPWRYRNTRWWRWFAVVEPNRRLVVITN